MQLFVRHVVAPDVYFTLSANLEHFSSFFFQINGVVVSVCLRIDLLSVLSVKKIEKDFKREKNRYCHPMTHHPCVCCRVISSPPLLLCTRA